VEDEHASFTVIREGVVHKDPSLSSCALLK